MNLSQTIQSLVSTYRSMRLRIGGFPIKNNPHLTRFLIGNWELTKKLKTLTQGRLELVGIHIIAEPGLLGSKETFDHQCCRIKFLIENWEVVGELLALIPKDDHLGFFVVLTKMERIIQTKDDISTVGNMLISLSRDFQSDDFYYMLTFGYPCSEKFIHNSSDLETVGRILCEIVGKDKDAYLYCPLFATAFLSVGHLVNTPNDLRDVGKQLVELAESIYFELDFLDYLFDDCLSSVADLIKTKNDLQKIVTIIKLGREGDKDATELINSKDFEEYVRKEFK